MGISGCKIGGQQDREKRASTMCDHILPVVLTMYDGICTSAISQTIQDVIIAYV